MTDVDAFFFIQLLEVKAISKPTTKSARASAKENSASFMQALERRTVNRLEYFTLFIRQKSDLNLTLKSIKSVLNC